MKILFGFLCFFIFFEITWGATPDLSYPEFNSLKKLTLGPDDQLDPFVDASHRFLIFTKRSNMITQLHIKNLETGEIQPLISPEADSAHGKLNQKGQLVFTYYKYNSFGDICWSQSSIRFDQLPIDEKQIKCVQKKSSPIPLESSQGFWHTNEDIIYLERSSTHSFLILYNTIRASRKVLLQTSSPLASPFGSLNGKRIVYSEVSHKVPQISILNIITQEKLIIPSSLLPGISGLMSLSEDETELYFSHYISDSNHDSVIDGRDNATIWKINLDSLKKFLTTSSKDDLKVQQLTPMNYNCSYPFYNHNLLFLTCAFQGSLDIYALDGNGSIPKTWNFKVLDEALATSRTYPDRILILNTKKFLTTDINEINKINQSLFYYHLFAEDYQAAQFYLVKSKFHIDPSVYQLLEVLLKALELEKNQIDNLITIPFKESMTALQRKITPIKEPNTFKQLTSSLLQVILGKTISPANLHTLIKNNNRPFEYWLYYRLMLKIMPQNEKNLPDWMQIYAKILTSKTLTLETQIFYVGENLDFLGQFPIEKRKDKLSELISLLKENNELRSLIENEIHVLNLISAPDEKSKMAHLQKIDLLFSHFKTNYFIRRSLNVRTLLNLLHHQELKYLNITATHWLRDTPKSSTEFSYARHVVIKAALAQAYGYWQQQKPRIAADYFFQSLSLTDDVESHSGYINTMTEIGQKKNMQDRMAYLTSHDRIPNGSKWLEIILLLENSDKKQFIKNLDTALKKISNLPADFNDPLKYLLTGFIYLEKIQRTQKGFEFHPEYLKLAQQNLILASDLSRENPRIQAAALSNLGLLSLWNQNYGQSIRFLELRKQLGFEQGDKNPEYKYFLWLYSQALFLNNQNKMAKETLEQIPNAQGIPEVIERIAFYTMLSENWTQSLKHYQVLEKITGQDFVTLNEPSRSKIRLSKAYVLFKLDQKIEAQKLFIKILQQKFQINSNSSPFRKMEFDSKHFNSIVYGFLSQLGTEKERILFLKKRIELLDEDLPALIQAQMKLAEILTLSDLNASIIVMQKTLADCIRFAEENGSLGHTVFKTLSNYLVHGIFHSDQYSNINSKDIRHQISKTLGALNKQMETANLTALKNQWHLTYLWNLYQEKVLKEGSSIRWKSDLMQSTLTEKIHQKDPQALKQIQDKVSEWKSLLFPSLQ